MSDFWLDEAEFAPGALGRAALNSDPTTTAKALALWGPDQTTEMAAWFRAVAADLDHGWIRP